jgi:hypothetical protein
VHAKHASGHNRRSAVHTWIAVHIAETNVNPKDDHFRPYLSARCPAAPAPKNQPTKNAELARLTMYAF